MKGAKSPSVNRRWKMGNFFNLGDYLDPIARVWGGNETNFAPSGRGRGETKKEMDPTEIKEDDTESHQKNIRGNGPEK